MRVDCNSFYSHVNYSVTKIRQDVQFVVWYFYSHVNYSVTKIPKRQPPRLYIFYSHVNYSVTKIINTWNSMVIPFTVT